MKSIKRVSVCILLAVLVLLSTACSPFKTAITQDEFAQKMDELGYEIQDFSEFAQGLLEASLMATGDDGIVVEFFVMLDKEQAQTAFESNRTELDSHKNTNFTERKTSGINYKKYELTSADEYLVVCQIDTTLMFLSAPKAAKGDAEAIIKALGY